MIGDWHMIKLHFIIEISCKLFIANWFCSQCLIIIESQKTVHGKSLKKKIESVTTWIIIFYIQSLSLSYKCFHRRGSSVSLIHLNATKWEFMTVAHPTLHSTTEMIISSSSIRILAAQLAFYRHKVDRKQIFIVARSCH